jgi:hypothetical protein
MDIVLQHYSLLNPQLMHVRIAMSRTRPSSLTNQHSHCAVFFLFVWRCGELAELHCPWRTASCADRQQKLMLSQRKKSRVMALGGLALVKQWQYGSNSTSIQLAKQAQVTILSIFHCVTVHKDECARIDSCTRQEHALTTAVRCVPE